MTFGAVIFFSSFFSPRQIHKGTLHWGKVGWWVQFYPIIHLAFCGGWEVFLFLNFRFLISALRILCDCECDLLWIFLVVILCW